MSAHDEPQTAAPWERRSPRGRKRTLRRLLPWLVVAGVLAAILWGFRPQPVGVETAKASIAALTVPVVEEGRTRIRNRYVVAAPVSGEMRRIDLKPGDVVAAGQTSLTTIAAARSPLLDPRAEAQARERVRMREAACKQAAESLELATTAARFAETQWERMRQLGSKGGISATDADNAERDALLRRREVLAAGFAVRIAEHELAQANAALAQYAGGGGEMVVEVKAPVSGRVLRVFQESATVVAAGTALVELGDPADIEIEAEILSRDAVAMQPGATVAVHQWGGPTPLTGRMRRVEPAAFTKISALGVEEQRVIVLIDLVNPPPDALALGDRYRVEVQVAVWHADRVLQVPAGALFREGSKWKTFVLEHGRARKTTIAAGHTDGRNTEVVDGLREGATVIVHPPDTLSDGTRVVPRVGGS